MTGQELNLGGEWVPSACTLPTAEQPVRIAEFDALFASAVQAAVRPEPRRLRLTLVFSPQVAAQAAELMARESACCSFFTFALTAKGGALELEAVVPDHYVEVLDALQARVIQSTMPAGGIPS